jgi:EpsI family protein
LALGAVLSAGIGQQQTMELRAPLETALPDSIEGLVGRDVTVSDAEAEVAGFTDYAMRVYESGTGDPGLTASVYIGFYASQTQGKTIHTPKNCLPGSGWEPLASQTETLSAAGGDFSVNRYILKNGDDQALVLYWYQGRGRVAHNEYLVKWDLLRDAATRRRTDEALARVAVPIVDGEEEAIRLARELAVLIQPSLDTALPL